MSNLNIPVHNVKYRTRVGKKQYVLVATDNACLVFKQGKVYLKVSVWKRDIGIIGSGKKTLLIPPDNYGLGSKSGVYATDIISFKHNGKTKCGEVSFDLMQVLSDSNPWNVITIDGEIFSLKKISDIAVIGSRLHDDSLFDLSNRLEHPDGTELHPSKPVPQEPSSELPAADICISSHGEQMTMDIGQTNVPAESGTSYRCEIYTDGSSLGNPGPSAWAFVIVENNEEVFRDCGFIGADTNNVAEYNAVIHGIKKAFELGYKDVLVRTDSKLVIDSVTKWAANWEKNGWVTKSGSPVANLAYVKELFSLVQDRTRHIDFLHVKGHNGDRFNELCDTMAKSTARQNA